MVGPNDRIARQMERDSSGRGDCMPTAKTARDAARRAKPEPDVRAAGNLSNRAVREKRFSPVMEERIHNTQEAEVIETIADKSKPAKIRLAACLKAIEIGVVKPFGQGHGITDLGAKVMGVCDQICKKHSNDNILRDEALDIIERIMIL